MKYLQLIKKWFCTKFLGREYFVGMDIGMKHGDKSTACYGYKRKDGVIIITGFEELP